MKEKLRLIVMMMGDFKNRESIQVRHRFFFEALAKRYDLVDVFDAGLRGLDRWLNALSVAEKNRNRWREHFYKNPSAFHKRSAKARSYLRSQKDRADLSIQIGALFDSTADDIGIPNVIYSDYTSVLSSRKPEAGRSPFNASELKEWLAAESSALHHAAFICSRSYFVRNSLIEDYKLPAEKIAVVGGGVNFCALPELRFKDACTEPTALFIGNNFYRKGGDVLLEAFQLTRKDQPGARLIMITTDTIPAGSPLENVTIIREHIHRDRLSQIYQDSDLFILPSRLETWGDVLLEAMAHGLPCIGVQSDAMDEIIENDRTGFLVPVGDPHSLADRMRILFHHHELRRSMGRAARKKVESEFLWEHVVDRLSPVLSAAAGKSNAIQN